LIVHNDLITQKFKNDSIIDQGDKVTSSVNSALYVVGMPFKLIDKGTVLTYEGLKFPPMSPRGTRIILPKMIGGIISTKIMALF